ncbi:MAG: metallophosphoesterase family protein [Pseudomonadota bacterium]
MAVWFTADHHFGQGAARGLFRRPFASTAAMDDAMVNAWNEVVAPADTVWHLGDFAIRPSAERVAALLAALNGTKHLVAGNNDPPATLEATGWASVGALVELEVDGMRLVLCHYALRVWNGQAKGAWNLHGHSHGRLKPLPRQADVGVDAWAFRPVGLATIAAARSRRKVPTRDA